MLVNSLEPTEGSTERVNGRSRAWHDSVTLALSFGKALPSMILLHIWDTTPLHLRALNGSPPPSISLPVSLRRMLWILAVQFLSLGGACRPFLKASPRVKGGAHTSPRPESEANAQP